MPDIKLAIETAEHLLKVLKAMKKDPIGALGVSIAAAQGAAIPPSFVTQGRAKIVVNCMWAVYQAIEDVLPEELRDKSKIGD